MASIIYKRAYKKEDTISNERTLCIQALWKR